MIESSPSTVGTAREREPTDSQAYRAALDWLTSRINYERTTIPYRERQLKLDRMRQLLTRLGQPDAGMKIIHVAGTKGKGSTSAMIAGILTAAGFRAGLFSSPHMDRVEERFAVDGEPCSADELIALVERVQPIVRVMDEEAVAVETGGSPVAPLDPSAGELPASTCADGDTPSGPTYFEITTAMALLHFVERQVDAAVLEVGMGGRLDSTNVCLPAVSVITSISFDHTRQLGRTLAAIAREKAGIIKPGVPVVCGVTEPEPLDAIAEVAREHGCRLILAGRDFHFAYHPLGDFGLRIADCGLSGGRRARRSSAPAAVEDDPARNTSLANPQSAIGVTVDFAYTIAGQELTLDHVSLAMLGRHQAANAAFALAAIAELRHQGWCISTDAMRLGLSRASLPGRVELVVGEPAVVLDTAHNPASAQALVETLAELPRPARRTLIVSISRDKDVRAIVRELAPHFDRFIVTEYRENPRAVATDRLAAMIQEALGPRAATDSAAGVEVITCPMPGEAWRHACRTAVRGELVCIAGSFYLTAEMRRLVLAGASPRQPALT